MLRDKIMADAKSALVAGERTKAEALRYLVSLLDKENLKFSGGQMDEAGEVRVLQKELKNKEESSQAFSTAGRQDLVEPIVKEIEWLKAYLPASISEEELVEMVQEVMASGEKQFGAIMKQVVAKCGGRADGAKISALVKQALGV